MDGKAAELRLAILSALKQSQGQAQGHVIMLSKVIMDKKIRSKHLTFMYHPAWNCHRMPPVQQIQL